MAGTPRNYVQYSKRMATCIMVFWAVYRILLLILVYLRPSLGDALKALLSGVDDVMMVSIGFYTGNSVVEKGLAGYFGSKSAARPAETDTDKTTDNG